MTETGSDWLNRTDETVWVGKKASVERAFISSQTAAKPRPSLQLRVLQHAADESGI